jgi:hypothetical protein
MTNHTTDQLLTLGMALTSDKRSMERRVRGVFARRRSAKGVLILSIVLALALGFAAFTTACQPGRGTKEQLQQALSPIPVDQMEDAEQLSGADSQAEAAAQLLAQTQLETAKGMLASAGNIALGNAATQTHITQPVETLPGGIRLLVDADVFVPNTDRVSILECNPDAFTKQEYETMIKAFLPNAKWTTTTDTAVVTENGSLDFSKLDPAAYSELYANQDGAEFVVALSGDAHSFWYSRYNGLIYDEFFLLGDAEMEREFGEIIREPILLTREAAQAKSDEMLSKFNARDWAALSAERACMFDINSGKLISRGWHLRYGLTNAGLSMRAVKGYGPSDRLAYWKINAGQLVVYVDESGVASFYWEKRYRSSDVSYPLASIIDVEDALNLAKQRITNLYGAQEDESMQIEVYDIRLAAVLIGYNDKLTGNPFPEVYEDIALLIPTWNVSFRALSSNGEAEYYIMPFSASDGGAVSLLE